MRERVRWAIGLVGVFLFAGCGSPGSAMAGLTHPPTRPTVKQVSVIRAGATTGASSRIEVEYGRRYVFTVPRSVRHQTIGVADTPKGVVLLLPPEWMSSDGHNWTVAIAKPKGPSANLLSQGARVLARIAPHSLGQSLSLVAVTQGYALVTENAAGGDGAKAYLWSIDLINGHERLVRRWNPGRVEGAPFVAGRGVVAWWDAGTGHATALDLSSGQTQTLLNIGSANALGWQNGGLFANGAQISLKFLVPYGHHLATGYKWLGSPPLMAIPRSWRAVPNSQGSVQAVDPSDSRTRVVVTVSHCEGCYRAGQVSNRINAVSGPDSPELQLPSGTRLFWLSDHAIAYTLPATAPGYRTYGVTVTAPQGGEVSARVTVPIADKATATTMLNSLWWP